MTSPTMLSNVKVALRVSSNAYDTEITTLIDAAKDDMLRVGVKHGIVDDESDPTITTAIITYCKANFGYDNADAARFDAVYRSIVAGLLNSSANSAAEDFEARR